MSKKKKILIFVTIGVMSLVLAVAAVYLAGPLYFVYEMDKSIKAEQKQILYGLDHEIVAKELRKFGAETRWGKPTSANRFDYYKGDDPALPVVLRGLGPSAIRVYDDRVEFECGGAFLNFGLIAYRNGIEGTGTKKLGQGIWYFSQNGYVPPK